MRKMPRILVLGSLNIDLVQRVPRLPLPGETIRGEDFAIHVGGKGANQACAASRLGGHTTFAGTLGSDVFAQRVRTELTNAGVQLTFVEESEQASGTATIFVLPSGENVIVIAPGANGRVSTEQAVKAAGTLATGDILLCQLEIPLEAVQAGLKEARRRGAITILDPAPAIPLENELLKDVSILTPNQTEAMILCDSSRAIENEAEARRAAQLLRARGPEVVVVKLGEAGCFLSSSDAEEVVPGWPVKAVDTTAAGDTFNGAFAVALTEGRSLRQAAQFANKAGAISVSRHGAIPSIPTRAEVDEFEGAR
jgi:ribokinase